MIGVITHRPGDLRPATSLPRPRPIRQHNQPAPPTAMPHPRHVLTATRTRHRHRLIRQIQRLDHITVGGDLPHQTRGHPIRTSIPLERRHIRRHRINQHRRLTLTTGGHLQETHTSHQRIKNRLRHLRAQLVIPVNLIQASGVTMRGDPPLPIQTLLQSIDDDLRPPDNRLDVHQCLGDGDADVLHTSLAVVVTPLDAILQRVPVQLPRQRSNQRTLVVPH